MAFNLRTALSALENDPIARQKAAEMIVQYGGDDPRNAELERQGVAEQYIAAHDSEQSQPSAFNLEQALQTLGQSQTDTQPMDERSFNTGYSSRPQTEEGYAPQSTDDVYQTRRQKLFDEVNAPVQKSKWWKNAAIIGAEIASNIFNPQNQVPIRSWGGLKKDARVRRAQEELGRLIPLKKFETEQLDAEATRNWRNKQAENYGLVNKRITDNQQRDDTSRFIQGAYKTGFNSKAPTPAQMLELKALNLKPEDIGDILPVNPKTGVIGGVQFERDPLTGVWKDSGRPRDYKEAFVEMQISDADGNDMGTFTVSSKDKAQFTTQLVAAGYQTKKQEARDVNEAKRRNQDKKTKWADETKDNEDKASQSILEGEALQNEAATYERQLQNPDLDAETKAALQIKIDTSRSQGNAKVNRGNELRKNAPKEPEYENENIQLPSNSGMVGKGRIKTSREEFDKRAEKNGIPKNQWDAAWLAYNQ